MKLMITYSLIPRYVDRYLPYSDVYIWIKSAHAID